MQERRRKVAWEQVAVKRLWTGLGGVGRRGGQEGWAGGQEGWAGRLGRQEGWVGGVGRKAPAGTEDPD